MYIVSVSRCVDEGRTFVSMVLYVGGGRTFFSMSHCFGEGCIFVHSVLVMDVPLSHSHSVLASQMFD